MSCIIWLQLTTLMVAGLGGTSDCSQQGAQVCRSAYAKLSGIDAQPGQELRGLWSALYGPHGLEIVTVSYTKDNIVATKILGSVSLFFCVIWSICSLI
jgi:hypothetical protein